MCMEKNIHHPVSNWKIFFQTYGIGDLACASRVDDNAIYSLTGETCGNGNVGKVASIGFDVTGYQFYETVSLLGCR